MSAAGMGMGLHSNGTGSGVFFDWIVFFAQDLADRPAQAGIASFKRLMIQKGALRQLGGAEMARVQLL